MTRKTARIDEPVDITKKELMVEDMSTALLDTGAKPSVIDTGTLQELGLGHREQKRESQVFGLGRSTVTVSGQVEVEIDLGDRQKLLQRLKVIEVEEPMFILGREFLSKFVTVEFNWNKCAIRLENNGNKRKRF